MLYHERGWVRPIEMPARRKFIIGSALAIGTLGADRSHAQDGAQQSAVAAAPKGDCKRTSLSQKIDLNASARRIYEALLDSGQFAAFSGAPARIDRSAGGAFSLFGGLIVGRNVELVPDVRIVQAWRPADWPPGVYSLVKFELAAHEQHTQLVLDHTGFPAGGFEHLNSGWKSHYWDALAKYLS